MLKLYDASFDISPTLMDEYLIRQKVMDVLKHGKRKDYYKEEELEIIIRSIIKFSRTFLRTKNLSHHDEFSGMCSLLTDIISTLLNQYTNIEMYRFSAEEINSIKKELHQDILSNFLYHYSLILSVNIMKNDRISRRKYLIDASLSQFFSYDSNVGYYMLKKFEKGIFLENLLSFGFSEMEEYDFFNYCDSFALCIKNNGKLNKENWETGMTLHEYIDCFIQNKDSKNFVEDNRSSLYTFFHFRLEQFDAFLLDESMTQNSNSNGFCKKRKGK